MTNDAKLGLVAGVGLVVLIAVVFFRHESTSQPAVATAAVAPSNAPNAGENFGPRRPATATSASHIAERPEYPAVRPERLK
jgi:hypothetical protein